MSQRQLFTFEITSNGCLHLNDSKVKLVNEDGETIDGEMDMKEMIEKFWGDLFCVNRKAKYGTMNELVDGGMKNEGLHISEQ